MKERSEFSDEPKQRTALAEMIYECQFQVDRYRDAKNRISDGLNRIMQKEQKDSISNDEYEYSDKDTYLRQLSVVLRQFRDINNLLEEEAYHLSQIS